MLVKGTEIEVVKGDIGQIKAEIVAPAMREGQQISEESVRLACREALRSAEAAHASSLALPALTPDSPAVPLKACAKIMAQEVYRYLFEDAGSIKRISFCLPDEQTYLVFREYALGYLDYIVNRLRCPFLTVDAIIEMEQDGQPAVVLIKRSNPPYGWALPGGFVDYGESLEEAVVREAKEETGLDLAAVKQFHVYSASGRDPRFHTVNAVYVARASGQAQAGDDAAGVRLAAFSEMDRIQFAFDHKKILQDYVRSRQGADPFPAFDPP